MRRRFAVPLIAAVGLAPWFWFFPEAPPDGLPARLSAVIDVPGDADWIGGLSGIDVSPDGRRFHMITDRGHWVQGTLEREGDALLGITVDAVQRLIDRFGEARAFPSTDAEGVAVDADGRVYVSFEHAHRVLVYDTWDSPARWPSYSRAWRALSLNKGLEALAVDAGGTLFTIPEQINTGAWESLVYRRFPGSDWTQAFTLPIDPAFAPVGADFGPDGRFYLLERGLYPFGFYSRVRAMTVTETGFAEIETVLQTELSTHGNLEGLAVWQDGNGSLRLTMVSDDNFYPFMRGEIVEYVLDAGLASQTE